MITFCNLFRFKKYDFFTNIWEYWKTKIAI